MKIETLLSQEDFFQESSFQKNQREKTVSIEFGFFHNNCLDIEQEFCINYETFNDKQNFEIQNKENITPQQQIQKCKTEIQELSVIKEENQSNFQQSQQKFKNSTEIFKENFKQIYDQYDEEQEFLFSENESKEEKNFEAVEETQLTQQTIQSMEEDLKSEQQLKQESQKELNDSWQKFQHQSNQQFKNIKITKISSSEKNSLYIQDPQIESTNSIQNTLMSNKSLDEENSFIQLEKEVQNKNCFKKQFTITELQDEEAKNNLEVIPEKQDKSPVKEKYEQSEVNKNDCAIFEIIKNSLLESKKKQNDTRPNNYYQQKDQQDYNIEKISINLDEDSIHEKIQTIEKQKREKSIKKTIQRLLEKGEQYKSTLRKKTQEKKKQDMKECSFTPKINQKRFNFKKQQQSSFILSSKHLETLDKSKVSYKSQIRSTSNITRNYNKKNFIKENIKKLKNQKFGTKSDIRQKPKKIIKFEEPTFKPTINRKSSIIASKRKKSVSPISYTKNKSQSFIQKPKKFKASNKSEKIIQKKILNKFYSVLIELQILQEIESDYGDIPISKIQLFQICLQMKFFNISQKKFKKISFKKKSFFENILNKNLIKQDIYNLLTVMWDFLSENDKIIYIRDLAFFILAIYGIRIENEGECVFDQKTILKIQSSFKQFKINSMRKEKIKSNKNLYSTKTQPIKSNQEKNSELASNYRSKLLDKYTDYITQGLLPMPKKQYLDHVDFLSLKEQIKEVELNQKRQLKKQNSLNECTFSPLVNSQISHKTLQPYRITEDFYESSKSVLKLEVKINGRNNETLFLCSEEDISKEVIRAQKKYNLKDKQVKKLQKVIKKQWKSYINDN